ncbi:MAG: XdhC family protein [Erysipelotrichaceae bacterium]|nr:XdhC family protein [Erysipelotrichaceae bacterium]
MADGQVVYPAQPKDIPSQLTERLKEVKRTGKYIWDDTEVYAEIIGAEKKMVICGAGHVSMPIIRMAKMIGFHVTVIDDRPQFTDNARQAGADRVICDEFMSALDAMESDAHTYFVIVTRGHQYDSDCLHVLLNKPSAYIGMMGSGRRVRIVKEDCIARGFDKEKVDAVHSPIGLKIRAQTPEEIAVSVLAEIIAEKNETPETGIPTEIMEGILGGHHTPAMEGRRILCTIVDKKGAAPRQVGTRMLYNHLDQSIATIGGGCTEATVKEKAREMFTEETITPMTIRVDLSADQASLEGEVCGGVIEVYMEEV